MTIRGALLWLAAGLLGAALYAGLMDRSQPESSVPLSVNRSEALDIAAQFLSDRGHDLAPYESVVTFRTDHQAKSYLEREVESSLARDLMRDAYPIFYWQARWYRAGEKDGFYVWVGVDGRIWGFSRLISDDAPGASIDEEEALDLALEALVDYHADGNAWEVSSQQRELLPSRVDHTIRLQRNDIDTGEASHRVRIEIQGDTIGAFSQYVHISEQWDRSQQRTSSFRSVLAQLSSLPLHGFEAIVLAIFLFRLRAGTARFGFALRLAGLAGFITFLNSLNRWALYWMAYPTTTSPSAYTGTFILEIITNVIAEFVYISMLAVVADGVLRRFYPHLPNIDGIFKRRFWGARQTADGAWAGICASCIHAGYFSVFYVVGKEWFGVWSPQQSPYSEVLSGIVPWAQPLAIGFSASITEELMFRVIMVGLILRYTGLHVAAVVIPAIIWAFLHSPYPQEPFYIRGIELTVIGIFYGVLFLRYGPIAPIISHFGYNALVSGTLLFRSDDPYYQLTGALVVGVAALPLLPGIWAVVRGRPMPALLPQRDTPYYSFHTRHPHTIQQQFAFRPISRRMAVVAVLCSFVAVGATEYFYDRIEANPNTRGKRIGFDGTRVKFQCTASEAIATARTYATDHGLDLTGYRAVAVLSRRYSSLGLAYLYEAVTEAQFHELRDEYFPDAAYWMVRFYIPDHDQEYYARVLPDGSVYTFINRPSEEIPGAMLSELDARKLATAFLRTEMDLEPREWNPADYYANELPARTDHFFEWERYVILAGGSIRSAIEVTGDHVGNFQSYVQSPEEWRRARQDQSALQFAGAVGIILCALVLALAFGVQAVSTFVRYETQWRRWFWPSAAIAITMALIEINEWPAIWANYPTSVPAAVFVLWEVNSLIETVGSGFISLWLAFTFVHAVAKNVFTGDADVPRRSAIAMACRYGGAASYAIAAVAEIIAALTLPTGVIRSIVPNPEAPRPAIVIEENAYLPELSTFILGVIVPVLATLAVVFLWSMIAKHLRTPRRKIAAAAAVSGCAALASTSNLALAMAAAVIAIAIVRIALLFLNRPGSMPTIGGDLRSRAAIVFMVCMIFTAAGFAQQGDTFSMGLAAAILAVHTAMFLWGLLTPSPDLDAA